MMKSGEWVEWRKGRWKSGIGVWGGECGSGVMNFGGEVDGTFLVILEKFKIWFNWYINAIVYFSFIWGVYFE